jgi:hypothetical protein
MPNKKIRKRASPFPMMLIISTLLISCLSFSLEKDDQSAAPESAESPSTTSTSSIIASNATPVANNDKWSLWTNGPQLRGANIYQRRVFPELDGTEFYGPGPFGPPYEQEDFDRLSELGANYVNISTAGLFTVQPPFVLDEEAVAHLDRLLEMIQRADMFAVITFRTGPGRSEFSLIGEGDWPPDEYIVDTVWADAAARKAWSEMWQFAARRYHDNPNIAGYDLMCEPNANKMLGIWEPMEFSEQNAGTGYDWNDWYPDIVAAVRAVDPSMPILVGGNGYSSVEWLPFLQAIDDPFVVYTFHQYAPYGYTNAGGADPARSYPGAFDFDDDGRPDRFDRDWLQDLLSIAADYSAKHHVPLAVNEFGVERWTSGGAAYVRDEVDLFEKFGWNYAAWQWQPAWPPLAEGDNSFNFRFGPDPENLTDIDNDLLSSYISAWGRNTVRPSDYSK